MSVINTEENQIKDLTQEEEIEIANAQLDDAMDGNVHVILAANDIFGDKLGNMKENALLRNSITKKSSEFADIILNDIEESCKENGYVVPDRYEIIVLSRKAGYKVGEIKENFACFVGFCDPQIVTHHNRKYKINNCIVGDIFNCSKTKPYIKYNETFIKMQNGKLFIKRKDYMSILIVMFWNNNPIEDQDKFKENELHVY